MAFPVATNGQNGTNRKSQSRNTQGGLSRRDDQDGNVFRLVGREKVAIPKVAFPVATREIVIEYIQAQVAIPKVAFPVATFTAGEGFIYNSREVAIPKVAFPVATP